MTAERRIWKYPFPGALELPNGARIVHVDGPQQQFWALVDSDAPLVDWSFSVVGTGWPLSADWEHVGTWMEPPHVWHLVRRRLL